MSTRKLVLNLEELGFAYDQLLRLTEQLHKEVRLNAKAAKTTGATNMVQLFQKVQAVVPIGQIEGAEVEGATFVVALSRNELRLLERICKTTKERLLGIVIPNYEEAIHNRSPEISERYKKQVVNLTSLCHTVLTPLIEKVEKGL